MLLLLAHSHFSPQSQERNWERLEVRKRDERETVGEASRSFSSLGCTSLSLSLSSHPNISPLISEIDRRDRGVGMKIRTRERDKRLHSSPFVCVMSLEMTRRGRERRRDMCEWKGRTRKRSKRKMKEEKQEIDASLLTSRPFRWVYRKVKGN